MLIKLNKQIWISVGIKPDQTRPNQTENENENEIKSSTAKYTVYKMYSDEIWSINFVCILYFVSDLVKTESTYTVLCLVFSFFYNKKLHCLLFSLFLYSFVFLFYVLCL